MPRRNDLRSICVLGAGPIVIGQACEFDYSGTQACKALRGEGYRVILINSNPATIMTDPDTADAIYIDPLTPEVVTRILEIERPDALLPTLGGQTALNLALALHDSGVLERLQIEMLGAKPAAIRVAEDREAFRELMLRLGLDVAASGVARSLDQARTLAGQVGIPCVLRPSFTLGGVGGGIVERPEDFEPMVRWALDLSPVHEVLIEESLAGWKEYEMEVMRDQKDRAVIVCSIENLDPMGVHTGDSITVAPAQTLTDREYQRMRDASIAIIRAVGVETGGSNIQFAIDPVSGRMVVIEMNPRVSRSSALASKATGFPIAKLAALLSVGYTLDELPNDITRKTRASFEPALDYVVTKIPRFAFEKFPGTDDTLTTQMKSVGEVMAIGRTFGESLLKALRCLESSARDLQRSRHGQALSDDDLTASIRRPHPQRLYLLAEALWRGWSTARIHAASRVNPWFLDEMAELVALMRDLPHRDLDRDTLRLAKQAGLADTTIAALTQRSEDDIRALRHSFDLRPVYKRVDTCAAEFEASTPSLYSTWEDEDEAEPDTRPRVIILGSGPNRIGQGLEFDYSCVKAARAIRGAGQVAIMINCNPETVSTDHDTSDRLYFEPIDLESVLEITHLEAPQGLIVHFGGQTPLRLAADLRRLGAPLLGTPVEAIEAAEDREAFAAFAQRLGLQLPGYGTARTRQEAHAIAQRLGWPLLVRPSHVLGGRAMQILHDAQGLDAYLDLAFYPGSDEPMDPRSMPLLLDRFLQNAVEVDVDALCDGSRVVIGGVLEQVERAGVHSGDSACLLPPHTLSDALQQRLRDTTREIALQLGVVGLLNVQYAVLPDAPDPLFVIEVNPRASRTVPFISKATGTCMTTLATHVMLGEHLSTLGQTDDLIPRGIFCKEVVLPLSRFPNASPLLGPEMRSTGEVMAQGATPAQAFARAQLAASNAPRPAGPILLDVLPSDLPLPPLPPDARLVAPAPQHLALTARLGRAVEPWSPDEDPAFALLLRPHGATLSREDHQRFRHLQAHHTAWFTSAEAAALWLEEGLGAWEPRRIG